MNLIYLIFSSGGQDDNQKGTPIGAEKPQKAARGAVIIYVAMIQQINSGHKIGAFFGPQKEDVLKKNTFC